MIYFNKRANDIKVFGDEVNNNQTSPFGISGEITNFDTKFLNLVIFFKSSEFFYESNEFCKEACGSTEPWEILAWKPNMKILILYFLTHFALLAFFL